MPSIPCTLAVALALSASLHTRAAAQSEARDLRLSNTEADASNPYLRTDITGYAVLGFGTLHLIDHGLRRDHSGFPFALHATPATFATFTVIPTYLAGYYYDLGPNFWILADSVIFTGTQVAHILLEPPSHQYDTWQKDHVNALKTESPVLGRLSQGVSIALSITLVSHLASSIYDGYVHGFEWTRSSAGEAQQSVSLRLVPVNDGFGVGLAGFL